MEVSGIQAIESAYSLAEAKTVLHAKVMDVVILDINLPDGNGLTLLEWIKQHYPAMTVIMFTNNSDLFFRKAAKKAGADHFLDKSMEFEGLIKILKTLKLKQTLSHETSL